LAGVGTPPGPIVGCGLTTTGLPWCFDLAPGPEVGP
jgi:hypothetical protein